MSEIPHYVRMREKHRSEGGFCVACRPRMKHPCEVAKLVIDVERQIYMIKSAQKLLVEIGLLTIRKLDRRYE